jgi:hypothetical protein
MLTVMTTSSLVILVAVMEERETMAAQWHDHHLRD